MSSGEWDDTMKVRIYSSVWANISNWKTPTKVYTDNSNSMIIKIILFSENFRLFLQIINCFDFI